MWRDVTAVRALRQEQDVVISKMQSELIKMQEETDIQRAVRVAIRDGFKNLRTFLEELQKKHREAWLTY